MSDICQLATHFSCSCENCLNGIVAEPKQQQQTPINNNSYEDLYQLNFTTTISAPLSDDYNQQQSTNNSSFLSQHQQSSNQVEREFIFHNFSSTNSAACVEEMLEESPLKNLTEEELEIIKKVEQVQQQQAQQQQAVAVPEQKQQEDDSTLRSGNNKPLSRRQKKKQHQKSFLDIAKSLRDSPKTFQNKPSSFAISRESQPSWCWWGSSYNTDEQRLKRYFEFKKQQRKDRRRLNRRQLLPDWCYDANENGQRSVRDMVVLTVGEISLETDYDFHVFDRRATFSHIRLPRSTAIAHRNKNRWICRNKIFNCRAPFRNSCADWSDCATLNKPDTRGLRNADIDCKFHGMDGRERYNRNGGHHRRPYRANGYNQGKQCYMGNSRKQIHGRPWLYTRQARIFKGQDRLQDLGW